MKKIKLTISILTFTLFLWSCSGVKTLNAWKAEPDKIAAFKEKNILVVARSADNYSRGAFEEEIAKQLLARGFKVTESIMRVPQLHPEREMTEKRLTMIKTILKSEGYTGIVVATIKDKEQTISTSSSGVYFGATYGNYYPGHYGGFYDYYSYPFVSGSYYNGFGGYVPVSTSVNITTNYVLETAAYNLDEPYENQLVAVVTTSLKDPKEAHKTAEKYVKELMESLDSY